MTTGMTTVAVLDPRLCWKVWIEEGSLSKVRHLLEDQGVLNPVTQRAPTLSAIQKAAYRWALENQEEAREDLEYAWNAVGRILTDRDWRKFLAKKAKLAYFVQPRKIERFLQEHNLMNV